MDNLFTKTDYKNFLECGCYLWLSKKKKELLPPRSASELFREQEGEKVDTLAKQLFSDAIEITKFDEEGWEMTKKLMDAKTKTLFQPTIITPSGLSCRVDILTYDSETNAWEIREVKSSTSARQEDIIDVAFQRICFEELEIPISKTYLIHIKKGFTKKGLIDPQNFFVTEDITEEVNQALDETRSGISVARNHLHCEEWPHVNIIESCTKPKSCTYLKCYLKGISNEETLARTLSPKYAIELIRHDILNFESLTKEFIDELGYSREEKYVDHDAIRAELKKITYPIYFFDYETYASPIPKYDGIKPWQQVPFQYSLHIQREKGSELEHREFIAIEDKNPIEDLATKLKEDIGETGSVIVWNASFEKTRNKEIANDYPEYFSFMSSVNERMFDLMVIFRKKLYKQHEFHQGYSIKKILPVLVPELSYKDLTIQEGGTASISWPILVDSTTPDEQRKELKKDMLLYCKLDTLAIVRILEHLEKEIKR